MTIDDTLLAKFLKRLAREDMEVWLLVNDESDTEEQRQKWRDYYARKKERKRLGITGKRGRPRK